MLCAGKMNAEEDRQFFQEMDKVGEVVGRLFRRHNYMGRVLRDVSLTWWGGRLLYSIFLQPVAANCLSLMADVDRWVSRSPHIPSVSSLPVPRLHTPQCAHAKFQGE